MKIKITIGVIIGIRLMILLVLMLIVDDIDRPDYTEYAKLKKLLAEQEIESSRRMEKSLLDIKEFPAGDPTPIKNLVSLNTKIIGEWNEFAPMAGSSMSIEKADSCRLQVHFYAQGCLDSWSLSRTGFYRNGILELDRPVAEYLPRVYKKLYTLKVGNRDYLVPDILAQDFKECLSKDGETITDTIGVNFCAFKRTK